MIHGCRTRADFDRLRREGVRAAGHRLWVRHVSDQNVSPPRVAYALSRRNGSAPRRNRLRRQLRAILRDEGLEVPPGLYLIGHRGPISPGAAAVWREELRSVLESVGAGR